MAWTDYTAKLAGLGFAGATVIDRSSYAVLAQHGDCIPRGYKDSAGADVNENNGLHEEWSAKTNISYNQVKYMVLRKDADSLMGKKGPNGIFAFKLKTIFLVGISDADKINMANANKEMDVMVAALKEAR
eukprot:156609_1